jgi:hypothetical protein
VRFWGSKPAPTQTLDITIHVADDPRIQQILDLLTAMQKQEQIMDQTVQAAFDDLRAGVAAEKDGVASAAKAIAGLSAQLATALSSSTDPTEIVAAVKDVKAGLDANKDALAQAVATIPPSA